MGLLDAIIGAHTANATQAASQEGQQLYNQANFYGNQALNNTTADANSALTTGAGSALDAITAGYGAATGAVSGYGAQGQSLLGTRTDQGVNTALSGNSGYAPAAATGGAASTALGNALGLNGAAGNAAATSAFQASPGYQFQVNQAVNGAQRSAAAGGSLSSGNTLDAITRLGSNLANNEYQNYIGNLGNVANQGLTAASGESANDRAAGTLQGTAGTTGATLLNNTGSNLGTLNAAGGTAAAGVDTGLGNALSANDTALGRNVASLGLSTAQGISGAALQGAQAQDAATSANNGILSQIIGSAGKAALNGFQL